MDSGSQHLARPSRRSRGLTTLLFVIFFVISLITNILGPLVPEIIQGFQIDLTWASYLPFSFFIAYAIMSIPAGFWVERTGEKSVLLGAFGLVLTGSMLFAGAPAYHTALLSLFLIGLGMAALQVAINPLLRVVGGEQQYAFNSVFVQVVFGAGGALSPAIYARYVEQIKGKMPADALGRLLSRCVPADLPWVSMYWIFSFVTVGMIVTLAAIRFPPVERTEEERVGGGETYKRLAGMGIVRLYFFGIFSYVGLEQGLADWMSQFLKQQHGFNPETEGAAAVGYFWLLITAGSLVGLLLLKFFDSRRVLICFSALALVVFSCALFGPREVALRAFPFTGFAISVMWSIIFALALNSLAENHGSFSGILCTGIVGGALVPVLIGSLGDHLGLRWGLLLLYLPLLYIGSIGFWARPLISNLKTGQHDS